MAKNDVLAKLVVLISANNAELGRVLNASQSQLKTFQKALTSVNSALTSFGVGFGLYQVKGAIEDAIGTIATFEHTMSEVKAITQATQDEFNALRDDALKLGASTKFTANEVGQLQVAYGRLGFTTDEILAATKATLDLSAATGEDLAKSADVAGSVVRAFGLTADETQRVVDVMASSFNKSALGLDNFSEAMKYVAPVAAAAGASIEETTALFGVLADAGIRGSTAGTSLRKIFTDISKDGRPLRERLAELGKEGLTFAGAMDEVGRTAQSSLLVLTKNTGKIDDLAFAFRQAGGEAAKTAAVMQDDLIGDFTKLTAAVNGLILSFSEGTGILREFVQSLTSIVNGFKGISEQSGILGKVFTLLASQVIAPFKALGALSDAIYKTNEATDVATGVQKKFREFAVRNGYKDLAVAAEDYKKSLYDAIIAEQISLDNLKALNATEKDPTLDADIERGKKRVELLFQAIAALNIYTKAKEDSNSVPVVPEGTIENYERLIKEQEALKKQSRDTDAIAKYNDEIQRLRGEIDVLNASTAKTTQTFKDLAAGLKISIPDVKAVAPQDNSIPTTTPAINGVKTVLDDLEQVNKALAKSKESWHNWAQGANYSTDQVGKAMINVTPIVTDAFVTLGEVIGNALSGTENFGKGIIKAIAGFAKQFGEILIASGVAALALENLIAAPGVAIAAGVALVAIAAGAQALVKQQAKSSFASVPNSGLSGGRGTATSTGLNISIDGRIEGRDIVFSYDSNKKLDGSRKVGG